jgi:hypothetical protein
MPVEYNWKLLLTFFSEIIGVLERSERKISGGLFGEI